MITLDKLTWSNCFSYGSDNEIDLSKNTLTQLVGTNGTGKSSIPLILEEVLFNKNSKGIRKADIANRLVNNGYDICLWFSAGEDEYKLDVSRRANIKVKLLKNGKDISSHTATNTYKTVEDIIQDKISKIDFEKIWTLVNTNYLRRHSEDEIAWHVELIYKNAPNNALAIRDNKTKGCTELTIYQNIRKNIFSYIASMIDNLNLSLIHI